MATIDNLSHLVLERLASYIKETDSVYDIEWAPGVNLEKSFNQNWTLNTALRPAGMLLENWKFEEAGRAGGSPIHPAYDYVWNVHILTLQMLVALFCYQNVQLRINRNLAVS